MPDATIVVFHSWVKNANESAISASDTWKMGLTTSSWTPSQSTHEDLTDVTNIINGSGVSEVTLSSVTLNESSGVQTLDFANPVFTASGGDVTGRYWYVYNDTVSDYLVAYGLVDDGDVNFTITDGNSLTMNIHASGLITWSVPA